jgi:hypothetical protein
MPEDIHTTLWSQVGNVVKSGRIICNREIYDELLHIPGSIGECLEKHCTLVEVGDDHWEWRVYLDHVERMRQTYKSVISEYNDNRKATVGLNDISIIAVAKTMDLPLISMEVASLQDSAKRRRIPDVCTLEKVEHLTFNEFLRAEGIRL